MILSQLKETNKQNSTQHNHWSVNEKINILQSGDYLETESNEIEIQRIDIQRNWHSKKLTFKV